MGQFRYLFAKETGLRLNSFIKLHFSTYCLLFLYLTIGATGSLNAQFYCKFEYKAPIIEINGISENQLVEECEEIQPYSITNADSLTGYIFQLGKIRYGKIKEAKERSWRIEWDEDAQTVGSFEIVATSPQGCQSQHLFEFSHCCNKNGAYLIDGGNLSNWMTKSQFEDRVISTGEIPIVIQGEVFIDVNATFLDCKNVQLGTNAKIVLKEGLTLSIENSNFRACGSDLWEGIIVQGSDRTIRARKSTFADAKCAIKLTNNAVYDIQDCCFENNWVGVGFFQMTKNWNSISKCVFESKSIMKRAFGEDNLIETIPYQGQNSSSNKGTGIYVNLSTDVQIGDTLNEQSKNEFTKLNYGIFSTNSSINVYNSVFKEIDSRYYTLKIAQNQGAAIFANSDANRVTKMKIGGVEKYHANTFSECGIAMRIGESVEAIIIGNTLNQTKQFGIYWSLSRKCQNMIADNRFNDQHGTAISIFNQLASQFHIHRNTISFAKKNPVQQPLQVGIHLGADMMSVTSSTPNYKLISNSIKNAQTGIEVCGVSKVWIEDNEIYVPRHPKHNAGLVNYTICGIKATACYFPQIIKNRISGADTLMPLVQGITLVNSTRCYVSCNSISSCGIGLCIQGLNSYSFLQQNELERCGNGFFYHDWGFTGPQGGKNHVNRNKWKQIYQSPLAAGSLGGSGPVLGTLSPWTLPLKKLGTPEYPDSNSFTNNGVMMASLPIKMYYTNNDSLIEIDCDTVNIPAYQTQNELNVSLQISQNKSFWDSKSPNLKYILEEQGFQYLLDEPQIVQNDSLISLFYRRKTSSSSGVLHHISESLHSKGAFTSSEKKAWEIANKETKANTAQEHNQKLVTEIYLRTFAIGLAQLTEEDVDTLKTIAATCYFQGGQAVLAARSMLNSRPNALPVQYADSCVNQYGMQRLAQPEKSAKTGKGAIKLYPNPVSKGQTLSIANAQGAYLRIVNVAGQLLVEKQLKTEQESISLGERFTAGLYFVHLFGSDGSIVTEKIVLK